MKVALVTGAGSGIGRAVARALAREGWTLALLGRREAPLQETLPEALHLPADVTDEAQVDAAFQTLRQRFGRLDLLFNNAGISALGVPIDELSVAQWRAVVDTNLTGSFLCARAAFALMKAQLPRGGRIINNGSISAHAPRPFSAPYTSTKHAITGLTKSLSLDGRAFDIACGQIDIGNAATDMTEKMARGMPQANGQLAVEPRMDVEDVARAVVYMASLPLSANVQTMTVMATSMPFVGRG
ncbi:MAG: SDR family oxidoreductase [Methylotenera sp.]|jgi:NAD(P)-dependent dehydrogenase (short-subunit alcohol dehydrogenase family)|nr:SDR family oxidoreductase [Methylotenera sp.]